MTTYTYKGRDLRNLPRTGPIKLNFDIRYLKSQGTLVEDIKALPFHRIIFLNLGGTCTVEAVEELWKQISLSDVLDELWVSEIPVLLKPFDLAIAPISTCLKRINLARVKVDHKYLKRSGKAISNNDKLETFTCSMLQTNPPCTESILPGLIFGSNRNLSIHLYDLFRVIDYFLLARHHLSLLENSLFFLCWWKTSMVG